MKLMYVLPFYNSFISGHVDYVTLVKSAKVEKSITVKINRKQKTTKTVVNFNPIPEHKWSLKQVML